MSRLSEQTSQLIRDELRLAQLEMTAKGKKAGLGVGLFGGAGVFALYGLACLVAAAILGLAGPVPDWLAAIIVGARPVRGRRMAAIVGKREVAQATPPTPRTSRRRRQAGRPDPQIRKPLMSDTDPPAESEQAQMHASIEQARAELADTVDALSDRLNVKARANDKVTESQRPRRR